MKKKILLKVVILIALGGITVALALNRFTTKKVETEVQNGILPTITDEELQEKKERIVEDGKFNVAIAEEIFINVETLEGKADIQNIPNNPYDLQVDIVSLDTGEILYSSELLKPNSYIEHLTIFRSLELGEYPCEAKVTALDSKTAEEIGSTTIFVKLNVIKEI